MTIFVAVKLLGTSDEFTTEVKHTVVNRVLDPSGETISELTGEFALDATSSHPDWLLGIVQPLVIQFDAEASGTYQISIEVDGASREQPLHIVSAAEE